jgi:hypothetical protein
VESNNVRGRGVHTVQADLARSDPGRRLIRKGVGDLEIPDAGNTRVP